MPPPGSNEQKIGDYYQSCMDTDAIDKAGLTPMEPELKRIAALHSKAGTAGADRPPEPDGWGSSSITVRMQDFKDATREIAYIDQSGLGLPEKDYYLRTDAKSEELRKAVCRAHGEDAAAAGRFAGDGGGQKRRR